LQTLKVAANDIPFLWMFCALLKSSFPFPQAIVNLVLLLAPEKS